MADLRLDDIGKTFANGIRALDDVSLNVAAGECLALVGPSGCGKTTLLRVIAGLEKADGGTIQVGGVNVTALPPHRREVAVLFQRPAFLLSKTVRQNLRLAWSLSEPFAPLRRWFGGERAREDELARIAHLLGLQNDLDRPVQQLSGGQQQRVALARCLLHKAKVTLLDEPLGHLDAPLRVELRRQIRAIARQAGLTIVHVTHDPAEAFAVGDRIAVMAGGRILQLDEPRQLRRCPNHRFVAELLHHEDGGLNWVTGAVVKDGLDWYVESPIGRWPVSLQIMDRLREALYKADGNENFALAFEKVAMMIGVPAARVRATTNLTPTDDKVRVLARVKEVERAADGNWIIGACGDLRWLGSADEAERFERDQEAAMLFSLDHAYWFDGSTGRILCAPTTG